jgi:hypothetical protein
VLSSALYGTEAWYARRTRPKLILGVVAYYISKLGVLEHVVLAIKEIKGNHKGENLAPVLIDVIRD